jgi:hypothetical protein
MHFLSRILSLPCYVQPQLIEKYGYPAEIHTVTTADNYILTIHRIPYSPKSPAALNKPVVFLQHGILSSSADWIILGPENSLGKIECDTFQPSTVTIVSTYNRTAFSIVCSPRVNYIRRERHYTHSYFGSIIQDNKSRLLDCMNQDVVA